MAFRNAHFETLLVWKNDSEIILINNKEAAIKGLQSLDKRF